MRPWASHSAVLSLLICQMRCALVQWKECWSEFEASGTIFLSSPGAGGTGTVVQGTDCIARLAEFESCLYHSQLSQYLDQGTLPF